MSGEVELGGIENRNTNLGAVGKGEEAGFVGCVSGVFKFSKFLELGYLYFAKFSLLIKAQPGIPI